MPFLALLKLIPLKDWLYIAAIVAIISLFVGYTMHERHVGAVHELAAVTKAGAKAEAAVEAKIKTLTDQHAATVADIEDKYEGLLKDADNQHGSDLQRLRDADTYRKTHSLLPSAGSSAAQADSGGAGLTGLESVSAKLADAVRRDDAALNACYADRDDLTGK
jgi:hypothetical protein